MRQLTYLYESEYVRIYFEGFLVNSGGQGRIETLGEAFRNQRLMRNDWLIWRVGLEGLYHCQ